MSYKIFINKADGNAEELDPNLTPVTSTHRTDVHSDLNLREDSTHSWSYPLSYNEWENLLKHLFISICDAHDTRSPFALRRTNRYITKSTFYEIFPSLPGVLADRLFSAFDLDGSGTIDYHEFIEGLRAIGTNNTKKLAFLHRMYDLNGDGVITKEEMRLMLSHISNEVLGTMTMEHDAQVETVVNKAFNYASPTTSLDECLDFPTFVERVEGEQDLRHILDLFCNETIANPLPLLKQNFPNEKILELPNELLGKACLIPKESITYCGWVERERRYARLRLKYVGVLRDRYLLLYRSLEDRIPDKTISLLGARIIAKKKDLCGQKIVVDLSLPKKSTNFSHSFQLIFIRGEILKLRTRTRLERDTWVAKLQDILSGKINQFHDVYQLMEPLGSGRFSTVFAAHYKNSGHKVAVKVMRKPNICIENGQRSKTWLHQLLPWPKKQPLWDIDKNYDYKELQRVEISVLRLLNHPNLVRLIDVFHSDEFVYIVMEWTATGDLRGLLDALLSANRCLLARECEASRMENSGCHNNRNTPHMWFSHLSDNERKSWACIWIPEGVVKCLMKGVVQGLEYLHSEYRSVVHRDIKPENILLDLNLEEICKSLRKLQQAGLNSSNVLSVSSEVSMDTVDKYPSSPVRQRKGTKEILLGADPLDLSFMDVARKSDDEAQNCWRFLKMLLWVFKPEELRFPTDGASGFHDECYIDGIENLPSEEIINALCRNMTPKITDFGFSKILSPAQNLMQQEKTVRQYSECAPNTMNCFADEPLGTEAYAAPEVLRGDKYSTSADVWSLGVLTYQLLSGGFFPSGSDQPQCPGMQTFQLLKPTDSLHFIPCGIWDGVSNAAKDFVAQTLNFNPSKRPTAAQCLNHPWLR